MYIYCIFIYNIYIYAGGQVFIFVHMLLNSHPEKKENPKCSERSDVTITKLNTRWENICSEATSKIFAFERRGLKVTRWLMKKKKKKKQIISYFISKQASGVFGGRTLTLGGHMCTFGENGRTLFSALLKSQVVVFSRLTICSSESHNPPVITAASTPLAPQLVHSAMRDSTNFPPLLFYLFCIFASLSWPPFFLLWILQRKRGRGWGGTIEVGVVSQRGMPSEAPPPSSSSSSHSPSQGKICGILLVGM